MQIRQEAKYNRVTCIQDQKPARKETALRRIQAVLVGVALRILLSPAGQHT